MQWIVVSLFLLGQAAAAELPAFLYTAAAQYDATAWSRSAERFPAGAHLVMVTRGVRRDVAPEFFASADAAVSWDGKRVLFAGRASSADRWQIWEVALSGGIPKRVVTSPDDCIRPLYLPNARIVYTRVATTGSVIEVVTPEGTKDVLTHAPGRYLTDDVLRDGRILFESRDELFTVYPDGTGVESVRCDHGPKRGGARQLTSGDVIFSSGGVLARYTSALSAQQKLPPLNVEVTGAVAEAAPDLWLVAARPRSGGNYSIHLTGPDGGRAEVLEAPPGVNAVDPVVAMARVAPRDFPSGLVATRATGNLLCLNVREAKVPVSGAIHAVRVYARDAAGGSQLLGQTVPAADGSFYVEVPANRPIRMELVDKAGTRLQGEEHWFWMRPSEQRVCVGCHAGPERAPENKVPDILTQTQVPVKMTGDPGRAR